MKVSTLMILVCLIAPECAGQASGLNSLIAKHSKVKKIASGYSFTEGPSVLPDGKVYFTDQPNDKLFVWDETTGVSEFLNGTERSNGTFADRNGNFYACADYKNSIIRITPDGKIIPVYDKGYSGSHFNGPNDLWIDGKGAIYFTDPYYHRPWWGSGHKQLLDIQGVYYLMPGGEPVRIIDDLEQPNGIVGTPDGKFLYVADIKAGKTWKYSINPDGTLYNKTFFAPYGSDGMALDQNGNVYLTAGKVVVFNPLGQKIGDIEVPEAPSNLCFGGVKRNILFITARTSVYSLKMKVKGVE
jgi:gluconolactonase